MAGDDKIKAEEESDKGKEAEAAKEEEEADGKEGSQEGRRRKRDKVEVLSPGREKRARKSVAASAYKPEDFSAVDRSAQIVTGTGTPLGDLAVVAESIEGLSHNSEDLHMAHRLLFSSRGRLPTKELKENILSFNGYLEKPPKGASKEETEKNNLDVEKKMSIKAYKLKIPELKKLCDIFVVDRFKVNTKDDMIEVLLNFLGSPSGKLLKGSQTRTADEGSSSKKSKKKKSEGLDDYEEIEQGSTPTETQLRQWVRAYVRCFNTDKVTLKDAMSIAEDKFGVGLKEFKELIKLLLTEEM